MKKVIKSKKVLFKCSQSFNRLLDSLWRSKKIQNRFSEVNSKSDLIRIAILNVAVEEYPNLIYLYDDCPELNEYSEKSVDKIEYLLKNLKIK